MAPWQYRVSANKFIEPPTDAELEGREASLAIDAELLESIGQMVGRQTFVVYSPVVEVRKNQD
jgi:hypothetical protein